MTEAPVAPAPETPVSGGTTGEATPPAPPAPEQNQQPTTVQMTQAELDSKFGKTRTEARLALAKKYGYETIEAMDTAMAAFKQKQDAEKTELQRAQEAQQAKEAEANTYRTELQTLRLEREAERQALALGVDPAKLDAVLRLRNTSEADLVDGKPDTELLKTSINEVLSVHPYFKTGSATVGTGSNPANANPNTGVEKNPWSADTRNLTEQARILAENPVLADKLRKQAKK